MKEKNNDIAQIPTDIKIAALIFMITIPVMVVCIGIGIYEKLNQLPEKDWRDGFQEFQTVEQIWQGNKGDFK